MNSMARLTNETLRSHEEPRVPNYADPLAKQILTEGLVITVEPIIAAGSGRAVLATDGWTVRTADRKPSAHYEHTLVVTNGDPILLTAVAYDSRFVIRSRVRAGRNLPRKLFH